MKGVKDDFKIFVLSTWKGEAVFDRVGAVYGWTSLGGG